jgi:hypothetical protein
MQDDKEFNNANNQDNQTDDWRSQANNAIQKTAYEGQGAEDNSQQQNYPQQGNNYQQQSYNAQPDYRQSYNAQPNYPQQGYQQQWYQQPNYPQQPVYPPQPQQPYYGQPYQPQNEYDPLKEADNETANALPIVAFILSFFVPVVAFILGIVALVQLKNQNSTNRRGFAIAAIVISVCYVILSIVLSSVVTALISGLASNGYAY